MTFVGYSISKPNGYAGDFDIIEKIHTKWISPDKHLKKWDHFGHWQIAGKALRNRKEFFKSILVNIEKSTVSNPAILNIGSGPCRDVYEYINENPKTNINIECLDMDSSAIGFSKNLLTDKNNNITFTCCNIFRCSRTVKIDCPKL